MFPLSPTVSLAYCLKARDYRAGDVSNRLCVCERGGVCMGERCVNISFDVYWSENVFGSIQYKQGRDFSTFPNHRIKQYLLMNSALWQSFMKPDFGSKSALETLTVGESDLVNL